MPLAPIDLTLGLRFVPAAIPSIEGAVLTPSQLALQNVVAMSGQYRWLAGKSADMTLQLDPGPSGLDNTYAVAPFSAFLDGLLAGLVDPGVTYTGELFLQDHILKDGRWVIGFGHIFKLVADGDPLRQEARIELAEYEVEILISVAIVP
jgi:hypothetical protein